MYEYAKKMSKSPLLDELRGKLKVGDEVIHGESPDWVVYWIEDDLVCVASMLYDNQMKVPRDVLIPLPCIEDWIELLGSRLLVAQLITNTTGSHTVTAFLPHGKFFKDNDSEIALCLACHWTKGFEWDGEWKKV